jgi:hypothetical protein
MGLFKNTYEYTLSASGPQDDLGALFLWTNDCPYELYNDSDPDAVFYSLAAAAFQKAGVGYIDLSMTNTEETDSGNMNITQFFAPIMVGSSMDGMFKVQVVVSYKGMINKTYNFKLEITGFDIPKKSPNTQEKFDAGFAKLKSFLAPHGFN